MSARTRLYAKPYVPPPAEAPVRRLVDLIELRATGQEVSWPETRPGDRGLDVLNCRFFGAERRDLAAGVAEQGGFLVPAGPVGTALEFLGSIQIATRAGAQMVDVENFATVPYLKTDPSLGWVSEGAAFGSTDPTFGSISTSMKRATVSVGLTRNLSILTGGISDRVVTRSLFGAIARGVDRAVFHGSGVSGQPTGIENTAGVGSVVGTGFSVGTAAEMLGLVEAENVDPDRISWCAAPDVAQILRQRPKTTGGEQMLLGDDQRILGRPTFISNSIGEGRLFCGDFSQVIVAVAALELLVNPFTNAAQGLKKLTVFWYGDVSVLRPHCFAIAALVT